MNPITDEDLVLYRYRDGLDAARIGEIERALADSVELRDRYAQIRHAIDGFDADAIEPDRDLSDRLWRRLEPRLADAGVIARGPAFLGRARALFAPRAGFGLALAGAFALAVAIGIGFLAGRHSAEVATPVAKADANAAAARVLDAYVASHLRETEGVLVTASNSDDASLLDVNRKLAETLVASNRLYALAAERAGNTQLAAFLRQLEPVLIALANQSGAKTVESSEDLRNYLGTTDLLFEVRATEARLSKQRARNI